MTGYQLMVYVLKQEESKSNLNESPNAHQQLDSDLCHLC